jgi:hypothetical protein
LSWVEAFTVFSVIVCSYFPNRWRDLSSYKLLILRTYRQFADYALCDYDKAFRQHAAATRLLDLSELNVQLFNFHTAGSAYRGPSRLTAAGDIDNILEGVINTPQANVHFTYSSIALTCVEANCFSIATMVSAGNFVGDCVSDGCE